MRGRRADRIRGMERDAAMDTLRYLIALVLVCSSPPLLLCWPILHGFIGFWRRRGPAFTYVVLLGGSALVMFGLYSLRGPLLAVDLGSHGPLVVAGCACLLAGAWLRGLLHRDITNQLLSGLPELDPEGHPQELVRTGLYAHVRHPRYSQIWLVLLGFALLSNYLAIYMLWISWLPAMLGIAWLEERELRERFGAAYEEYAREVPRFFPRLRRPS